MTQAANSTVRVAGNNVQAFNPATVAAVAQQMATSGAAIGTAANKQPATLFLAIGFVRDGVDLNQPIDPKQDIVNLPQLIGLDNMKPDDRRASTQEFADEQAEKNDMLADLVEQSLATLEPGEIRVLGCDPASGLIVTIYRKKDEIVAAPRPKAARRTFF